MAKLPYSRVVNVTLTRADRFPTRIGFGTPIVVTTETKAGVVDGTIRTKLYGSMEEVAEDWVSTDMAYQAALAIFSQNPRPVSMKIGHVPATVLGATPTATMAAAFDALWAYDADWYFLTLTADFRDDPNLDDLIAWAEPRMIQLFLDSNDATMEDPANTTNVAARNKNGAFDRTSVFYHTDPTEYVGAATAAYAATRNFDQADTAYTQKFKRLRTISPVNLGSAAVQAITGFVPAVGLSPTEGHLANTYVDIGGLEMVVEGNTLVGAFIDEIHAADWMVARTQAEVLSVLANNDRVPYTNTGMHMLVSAVEQIMQRAFIAGLIADIEEEETGALIPVYTIEVERVENIPPSQRRSRVAPDIICEFRYAGAVHYATVRMTMQF